MEHNTNNIDLFFERQPRGASLTADPAMGSPVSPLKQYPTLIGEAMEMQKKNPPHRWCKVSVSLFYGVLSYQKTNTNKSVALEDCNEIVIEENRFILVTSNRKYRFRCSNPEMMQRWQKALDKSFEIIRSQIDLATTPVNQRKVSIVSKLMGKLIKAKSQNEHTYVIKEPPQHQEMQQLLDSIEHSHDFFQELGSLFNDYFESVQRSSAIAESIAVHCKSIGIASATEPFHVIKLIKTLSHVFEVESKSAHAVCADIDDRKFSALDKLTHSLNFISKNVFAGAMASRKKCLNQMKKNETSEAEANLSLATQEMDTCKTQICDDIVGYIAAKREFLQHQMNDIDNVLAKLSKAKSDDGLTLLHVAASSMGPHVSSLMVRAKADVNAQSLMDGLTPLHYAVLANNTDAMTILLQSPVLKKNIKTKFGDTAMHIAAADGSTPALRLLVHAGEDELVKNADGFLPLDIAIHYKHTNAINFLSRNIQTAAGGLSTDINHQNPMEEVPNDSDNMNNNALLLSPSKLRIVTQHHGDSLLHIAVAQSNTEVVKALITEKADVNAIDFDGFTSLHRSIEKGDVAITRLLLEAQADPNAATKKLRLYPLHLAVLSQNLQLLEVLLKCPNIHHNATTVYGDTALHIAASQGLNSQVLMLIQYDETIDPINKDGVTPAQVAANLGHEETERIISTYVLRASSPITMPAMPFDSAAGVFESNSNPA